MFLEMSVKSRQINKIFSCSISRTRTILASCYIAVKHFSLSFSFSFSYGSGRRQLVKTPSICSELLENSSGGLDAQEKQSTLERIQIMAHREIWQSSGKTKRHYFLTQNKNSSGFDSQLHSTKQNETVI